MPGPIRPPDSSSGGELPAGAGAPSASAAAAALAGPPAIRLNRAETADDASIEFSKTPTSKSRLKKLFSGPKAKLGARVGLGLGGFAFGLGVGVIAMSSFMLGAAIVVTPIGWGILTVGLIVAGTAYLVARHNGMDKNEIVTLFTMGTAAGVLAGFAVAPGLSFALGGMAGGAVTLGYTAAGLVAGLGFGMVAFASGGAIDAIADDSGIEPLEEEI